MCHAENSPNVRIMMHLKGNDQTKKVHNVFADEKSLIPLYLNISLLARQSRTSAMFVVFDTLLVSVVLIISSSKAQCGQY